MDYGALLEKTWKTIWEHKYLLLLGFIASLSSGNGGGGGSGSTGYTGSSEDFERFFADPAFFDRIDAFMGAAAAAIIGLICIVFIVAIVVWFFSTVAHGGLIAGVQRIERGEESSFGSAWRDGWARKWSLAGIRLVIILPVVIIGLLAAVGFVAFAGISFSDGMPDLAGVAVGGMVFGLICVLCLLIPVVVVLSLWSEFALRACMIEGAGVIASYQRGWEVLRANLGPAIILVLIQFGIGIAILIPGFFLTACCLLWPFLLVLSALVTTFFSTLWTLAWREWTAIPPADAANALPEPAAV